MLNYSKHLNRKNIKASGPDHKTERKAELKRLNLRKKVIAYLIVILLERPEDRPAYLISQQLNESRVLSY